MTRKNKDSAKLTRRTFAAGTAAQTAMQQRRGVVGSLGLRMLLMGSASVAALTFTLRAHAQEASPTPIPDISVTAPMAPPAQSGPPSPFAPGSLAAEGSEAAGYKPTTVSDVGPLGRMPIQDVPYSVNVMSSALIENQQAANATDLLRINPFVQIFTPAPTADKNTVTLRGFLSSGGYASGHSVDGIRVEFYDPIALEDKERVEVWTGLTSFLYGPANVGGLINYVYKRPTQAPLADVTIGDYGGLSGYVHADLGGPIDKEGRFAYRLNIVGQDGNTEINGQRAIRQLVTGALDWHIAENLTMSVLASHQYWNIIGYDSAWYPKRYPTGALAFNYQTVPNPSDSYNSSFNTTPKETDLVEWNTVWKINEIFTLRSAYYGSNNYDYSNVSSYGYALVNNGTYTRGTFRNNTQNLQVNAGYGLLDASFNTWDVTHKMTMGFYGDWIVSEYGAGEYDTDPIPGLNISNPINFNPPALTPSATYAGARYPTNRVAQSNFVVGDDIKFNQYISALVGGNYSQIKEIDYNYGPPTQVLSTYDAGKLTPSLSLIFKPVPWLSTYGTYSQSLEEGAVVPANTGSTIYTNAGQVLPPYLGEQFEVGAKAEVGGMLLTAAIFQISKALQYTITNNDGSVTYHQDGRQVNKGVELGATGNIWEGFRLYGGITLLDPRVVNNQSNPQYNGKYAQFVSNEMVKFTAEYDIPSVRGLTLIGGVYYTGKAPADQLNSQFIPGYVTEDLGLRYRTNLPSGQQLTLRFNVTNLANEKYWVSPYYVGAPRTFLASAQVKF